MTTDLVLIIAMSTLAVFAVVQVVINRRHDRALHLIMEVVDTKMRASVSHRACCAPRCTVPVDGTFGGSPCGMYLLDGRCAVHGPDESGTYRYARPALPEYRTKIVFKDPGDETRG